MSNPLLGVNPILPTPFSAAGELDTESLRRLMAYQLQAGVHGVAILGFLGEAHKLSESERDTVTQTAVASAESLPVWVGVRALGTAGAIEQAQRAEALGAAAVFVAPISPQSDAALFDHYAAVAEAIRIPVIIHDFPASFGITLSPELIAKLALAGHAPYIKLEEPPVLVKLSKILELSGGKIGVFGGLGGEYFIEELARGALGIMTGFAFPEVLVKIYTQYTAGDIKGAEATFDHYATLIRYEFQPKIGLAFRKHNYWQRGIFSSPFIRKPGMNLDETSKAEFEALIHRVGLTLDPV